MSSPEPTSSAHPTPVSAANGAPADPAQGPQPAEPVLVPLSAPSEGIPEVINTAPGLNRAIRALRGGQGALAVDTERASGFRYGQRAFLIQLRREGAGTWLIDPEELDTLQPLADFVNSEAWVLHAATQDLPCLHAEGLYPDELFDTELAGRLAGFPRVALGTMVAQLLNLKLAKEHSAVDWSTRPLPESWLSYAALDVEVLLDLRERMEAVLAEQHKLEFARQEFEYVRTMPEAEPPAEPWRRLSGIHKLKNRRALAIARELWLARDALARSRDVAPGRLLSDSAIMVAVQHRPSSVPQLLQIPGFHGRSAKRDAPRWLDAISRGKRTQDVPDLRQAGNGLPNPRVWTEKNPAAADRLGAAKAAVTEVSEAWNIPAENLITPKYLRQLAWEPPTSTSAPAVEEALEQLGARPWQRELLRAPLATALAK